MDIRKEYDELADFAEDVRRLCEAHTSGKPVDWSAVGKMASRLTALQEVT